MQHHFATSHPAPSQGPRKSVNAVHVYPSLGSVPTAAPVQYDRHSVNRLPYPQSHDFIRRNESTAAYEPSTGDAIKPTYIGHIKTSTDAILLLAACDLSKHASALSPAARELDMSNSTPPRRIHRRLLEAERPSLIRSGSVFVWDERDAGMRRWTDGRCWSASRVSGCFLTYRELEVRKRSSADPNGPRSNLYRIDGLIKQSFSMTTTSGRKLHIVSYYTKRDLRENRLRRVSEDPRFVGEAGGEWGLTVDENEFPDPALAFEQQQRDQHQQLVHDHVHARSQQQPQQQPPICGDDANTLSPRQGHRATQMRPHAPLPRSYTTADPHLTSAAADRMSQRPPLPRVPFTTSQVGSAPSYPMPPAIARRWPLVEEPTCHDNSTVTVPSRPQRPLMKRMRSSSFTPTTEPVNIASVPVARRLSEDCTARMGSNNILSMSNIRSDPVFDRDMKAGQRRSADDSPDSNQTDQDGASALLSLRSSLGNLSYGRGSGSLDTPTNVTSVYSPDDSPSELTCKDPSTVGGPPHQRPSLPGRAASDRDALNRFSIRF